MRPTDRHELLHVSEGRYHLLRCRLHDLYAQDQGTPNPLLWFVLDNTPEREALGCDKTKRGALREAGLEEYAELCGCPRQEADPDE